MRKPLIFWFIFVTVWFVGCGGPKVTRYEDIRITSIAWSGDTLIAYVRNVERGFFAGGVRRNPKQNLELWVAEVDPERGSVDTTYQIREIPEELGRIEFFPAGGKLLYAARDGVRRVDLISGKRTDFFTHPSITKFPVEIDIGPNDTYTAIVVDAEGFPGTESLLDLFMVETETAFLTFHTDSLLDPRCFSWTSEDCIVYISPDPWDAGKNKIMQFGVTDCIVKPSDLTEEEVRCNCPSPGISASGLWEATGDGGKLAVSIVGE